MDNKNVNRGIDICVTLLIAFVVLKFVGVIKWSWWWVLSPIWITYLFAIFLLAFVLIREIVKEKKSKTAERKRKL